jgi:adenylate cyclase
MSSSRWINLSETEGPSIKLATGFFFPKVIAMTKALPPLPAGWVKARLYHLLAPLAALVAVGILTQTTPLVDMLENLTVNLRFKARAPFDPPADPRLVFVGIDELSLAHFGKWPWPRYVEADLIKAIANAGVNPHTLAFDLMFTEDSNKLDPARVKSGGGDDAALGDAAELLPSVITGALSLEEPGQAAVAQAAEERTQAELSQPGPTMPLPNVRGDIDRITGSGVAVFPVLPIRTQSLFGFVNDDPSPIDDIRHTLPLVLRVKDKVYPSLALQALCQMLNVDPGKVEVDLPDRVITLKNASGKTRAIPINERGEFSINYRRQEAFRTISFFGLMQNLNDHATSGAPIAPECDIENKTLLIGEAATGLGDMGPTPLVSRSPLPFVHLNAINNVLQNDYLSFVPWYWVVVGWSLVTWPTLLRLKEAPLVEAVLVPIGVVVLYTVFAFGIFWFWSAQIALAWPVLSFGVLNFGAVVLRWREEQRGRQELKQLFSSMLSPEVLNHLLEHPENVKLGGSERAVTILFSDIRDYTKFSEGLSAAEVVRQLNVYFERMVGCVKECRGTFHKYIGDAIMAAWGDIAAASLGPEQDARNAVRSALMMRRGLRELNEERKAEGLMPLRIGIGLNHGAGVLVGLIGASSQMEFTVMGDAVNVASRLEGMTKTFKTDLAISESVRLLIGDGFLVRRLGLIVLVGKTTPTVVYEVLAEKSDPGESRMSRESVARYEEAFDHFLARRFAEAEAGFQACEKEYPDDYCVKSYLQASREFSAKPPPPEWDGRVVMETK